ncbi:hypothetical protein NP493_5363g00009 [Ridgeia piscesae]|uniref:C-type lectin domain-containing protein n=1 Tax=Ridgeia piscesae TaxID=27915 RepID=A0AAD9MRI1_RIDPI|nr:hypothetical protein NP493_5363g00009 [Ridgeia piscesae]
MELIIGADVSLCPDGWTNWTNYCYHFSSTSKSFEDAKFACNNMSSHLVSVHSRAERTFLTSSKAVENYDHWIGLRRNTTKQGPLSFVQRDWHWVDGTTFDFDYWTDPRPETSAPCAVVTKQTGIWHERYCHHQHRFICTKDNRYTRPAGKHLITYETFARETDGKHEPEISKSPQSRETALSSVTSPATGDQDVNPQTPEAAGEYCYVTTPHESEPVSCVNTTNTGGATYVNTRDAGRADYVNTADSGGPSYVNTGQTNTNVTSDPSQYQNVAVSPVQTHSGGGGSLQPTSADYETMTPPATPYENIEPTGVVVAGDYESLGTRTDDDKHVYEAANGQVT